jgi:hypothetical protein
MKKLISVIAVFFLQTVCMTAQFLDTLTVVELEKEMPSSYSIAFGKQGGDFFYYDGKQEEKIFYSEIKNGMTRYITKDKKGAYSIHLIKEIGKGYYHYIPMVGFDSLSNAKSYTPDLKLFSYGFTRVGLGGYMKKPELDTITKKEVLDFLAYQFNTFSALKDFCGYLVKHSAMRDNFKTGKELYAVLRERFQVQAYLNWLTSKGYNGSSYLSLVFKIVSTFDDKAILDKATEYDEKEKAFYE